KGGWKIKGASHRFRPDRQLTIATYGAANRRVTVYDPDGNVTRVIDPRQVKGANLVSTFIYDADNRVVSATDPAGDTTLTHYDPDGTVDKVTAPRHLVTVYGYDRANRQVTVKDPMNHIVTTDYDAAGEVHAVHDPRTVGGVVTDLMTLYTYDLDGRLKT